MLRDDLYLVTAVFLFDVATEHGRAHSANGKTTKRFWWRACVGVARRRVGMFLGLRVKFKDLWLWVLNEPSVPQTVI